MASDMSQFMLFCNQEKTRKKKKKKNKADISPNVNMTTLMKYDWRLLTDFDTKKMKTKLFTEKTSKPEDIKLI